MKKFLCYDTNDAASGKIGVDSRGILKPNSTVPSTDGSAYQQLVTDGNGNTKWEDRLAYETFGYGEIIPEQTYSFSKMVLELYGTTFEDIVLLDGESYSVNFDGQLYDCVWQQNEVLGGNCFGNLSWAGLEDTGEPFFGMRGENGGLVIATSNTSPEHTVSVSGYREIINKISEKYLPIAASGHYGVVDRDNIVVPYKFSRYAVKSEIENALGEAQQGKAIIDWDGRGIRTSSFLSGGGISVTFENDPYAKYTYRPQDGRYDITKYESITYPSRFTLSSSTSGSSKKFKITVDDSGAITATEV